MSSQPLPRAVLRKAAPAAGVVGSSSGAQAGEEGGFAGREGIQVKKQPKGGAHPQQQPSAANLASAPPEPPPLWLSALWSSQGHALSAGW